MADNQMQGNDRQMNVAIIKAKNTKELNDKTREALTNYFHVYDCTTTISFDQIQMKDCTNRKTFYNDSEFIQILIKGQTKPYTWPLSFSIHELKGIRIY
jgi:hypothetical protein